MTRRSDRVWGARVRAGVVLAMGLAAAPTAPCAADFIGTGAGGLRISEIRVDQSGADLDEYFEISGGSGALLSDWWFVALGDSGSDSGGVVEMAINLSSHSLGVNGYFVGHEASFGATVFQDRVLAIDPTAHHATFGSGDALNFENADNITYLLVRDFNAAIGSDLDMDNDGTLDLMPWNELADSVALVSNSSTDPVYSATRVGPIALSATGGMPPHAWRNGSAWEVGSYASWEWDTPGTGPAVPAPAALSVVASALAAGGYHRPRRRR